MPEEPKQQNEQPETQTVSEIEKLRNEFQEQFNTMKTTFAAELEKSTSEIQRLQKENEDLHRALVRSAQLPPAEAPVQKTEEEIYKENVAKWAAKSLEYEKIRGP